MRRHIRRGLVLAAPVGQKPRARDAAPNLWSILSLMIELQPSGAERHGAIPDSEAVRADDLRATADEQYQPRPVRLHLRRIDTLLTEGKSAAAAALAQETVAGLRGQALRSLSIGLDNAGRGYRDEGDLAGATAAYEESLQHRRRLVEIVGETPQTLRGLSVSLNSMGDLWREIGDLAGAVQAYEESLLHRRRLVDTVGETRQTLRDLSMNLTNIGEVHREAGNLADSFAALEESVALDRRLAET